jgi:hypothetical protein
MLITEMWEFAKLRILKYCTKGHTLQEEKDSSYRASQCLKECSLNRSIVSSKQCLRARSLNRNINPSIISYFPCFLSSSSRRVFTMTSNQRLFTLVLPFPSPCLTSFSSSLKRVSSNHLYVSFLDQSSPPPHRTEVLEPVIDMAL